MFRITLRELLLIVAIVALGTVFAIEHWPRNEPKMSPDETGIYSAAVRYCVSECKVDGLQFLSIAGADPPREFTGLLYFPASDSISAYGPDPREYMEPMERIRHRITREPGTVIDVRIVKWAGKDRVQVRCSTHTAGDWGESGDIYLRRVDGRWRFDGQA